MCCPSCSAYVVHAKYISEKAPRLRSGAVNRREPKCAFRTVTPVKCALETRNRPKTVLLCTLHFRGRRANPLAAAGAAG